MRLTCGSITTTPCVIYTQSLTCDRMYDEQGYTVARMFFDEGFSGMDLDRPGFVELKEYMKANQGQTLIVPTPSVLSRDLGFVKHFNMFAEMCDYTVIYADGTDMDNFKTDYVGALSEHIQELERGQ
nr:recombinase family protein [Paenibacillus sp. ACRRX]